MSKRNRHHERHVSKWTHRISGIECNVEESGINAHVHLKSGEAKYIPHGLNGDNQARIFVGGDFHADAPASTRSTSRRGCSEPNQLEPVIAAAPVADLWKKLRRSGSSSVADPAIIRGWLRASAPP